MLHGTCCQFVAGFCTDHPQGTTIHGNLFLQVTNPIHTCHDIMKQKENLEKYGAKKSDHDLITYAFDALWFLAGFIYVVFLDSFWNRPILGKEKRHLHT